MQRAGLKSKGVKGAERKLNTCKAQWLDMCIEQIGDLSSKHMYHKPVTSIVFRKKVKSWSKGSKALMEVLLESLTL